MWLPVKVNILKMLILFSDHAKLYVLGFSILKSLSVSFIYSQMWINNQQITFQKSLPLTLAAFFPKPPKISKGVIYNICQSLLKEWGPESLGVLHEDTMQQLLTGVILVFLLFLSNSIFPLCGFLPILPLCSL